MSLNFGNRNKKTFISAVIFGSPLDNSINMTVIAGDYLIGVTTNIVVTK